jgi:hypothetical protein
MVPRITDEKSIASQAISIFEIKKTAVTISTFPTKHSKKAMHDDRIPKAAKQQLPAMQK